jgi:signal transduction histidine kinase
LLRPTDPTWQWVLVPILIGVCCAIVGIFTTALSLPITRLLQTSEHRAPVRLRPQIRSLVHWFEAVYNQCPTSIRIIAEFQVMIVLVYLGFDLTPRVLGSGVGGGYSVLFAAIPFSYLLLYSDTQAQHQGRWLTRLLLLGVAGIQLPNLAYRFLTGNYGTGANASDLATLVLVAIGTIGGGVWIGFGQWRRRRRHLINPAQEAIDHLFEKETQATFWCHLTNEVGRHVGVHQWLWIVRQLMHEAPATTGEWQIISQTARTRSEWLVDPGLQSALTRLSQARTSSVVVDTTELPSTLVLLPIYRNDLLGEVLIAVNPQWVSGELPVEHTVLLSRLMQAITLLRNREREHYLLAQQTQIAEQRGQINEAYRQLTRMQREQTFRENLRFSTLLHDHTLQQLAALTQHLQEQQAASLMPAQRQTLAALEQQCRTINRELRQIASELRPPGVGQALRYSLEQAVMTWEQHHHTIQFDYSFAANEASLDEFQRDSVYMLVEQLVENALKHAAATAIIISVRQEEQSLIVEVSDNGRGFSYDPTQIRSDALGLLLRQDIAHELGATLTIDTRPGAGCHVTLVMPYSAAESA